MTYRSGRGQQRRKSKVHVSAQPSHITPTRDIQRVRQRYMQQTKDNLVERLIAVEQEYAACQEQLARLQFEVLDLQQQLEEAEHKSQPSSPGKGGKKAKATRLARLEQAAALLDKHLPS